jgi:hypothetical protein
MSNPNQPLGFKQRLKRIPLLAMLNGWFKSPVSAANCLRDLREITMSVQTYSLQHRHPNPLNKFGAKCFSQADEDGITLEILRRLDALNNGTFAEFGVGDGTENNTLVLKALGWAGFWAGGDQLQFEVGSFKRFAYFRDWITLDNIVTIAERGTQVLGIEKLDVISLDLDGNDFYFVERLLKSGFTPKLFIVEYNAKFLPPINWKIEYNPAHKWNYDDYFGASLSAFVSLFESYNFRLICCNSQTGANAFFIRKDFESSFEDVPKEILDIYAPPRYFLPESYGHRPSIETIVRVFESND